MDARQRSAAQTALDQYRAARQHTSSDAEDMADLIADLAHLADLSDDPDCISGKPVLQTAADNYAAESAVWPAAPCEHFAAWKALGTAPGSALCDCGAVVSQAHV